MASAERSFLGLAKQIAAGTPNTTDADFKYLLFQEGSVATNPIVLPLDREVGGGALQRAMAKVGVNSGGALRFVPRPETLGWFFYGVTGAVSTTADQPVQDFHTHEFALGSDHFSAPYFTLRSAPGNLWGEQLQDCRVSLLSLEWAGANYVRGSVAFVGGLSQKVATTNWNALAQVDSGPQFLTPYGDIELPTGSDVSVLSGNFTAIADIPLDEQYVVGKFQPEGLDIVSRSYLLTLNIKITDDVLYTKMMYDPDGGNAWTADIFKEANIKIEFGSDQANYKFSIAANGQTGDDANVFWSAAPIAMRAGRQLIMQVTGLIAASPTADDPITLTLVNKKASY